MSAQGAMTFPDAGWLNCRIERAGNEMAGIVGRVGMGSDVSHIRAVLKEIFENAAIRRNAEMLIDGSDIRSREAAIRFKMLIGTIDIADADLVAAFHELWVGREDERAHLQLLTKVGYEFWPQNAAEFLSRFIAERTGSIRSPDFSD